METISDFISKHWEACLGILFSGLGVALLKKYFPNYWGNTESKDVNTSKNDSDDISGGIVAKKGGVAGCNVTANNGGVAVSGANDVTLNINTSSQSEEKKEPKRMSLSERKAIINILFVDDENFDIVKIIKNTEGWKNTKLVKDVTSLNSPEVIKAHIIFVDINGVGTKLYKTDQGLGLARGIKKKYPQKKVVIYSAESKHDSFNEVWDMVDGRLLKNADPIQFYNKIENLSEEIEL